MPPLTIAHVTHEACEKIGGIGSVLEGFITSPVYQQRVGRTILIGPYPNHLELAAEQRLGSDGQVLYSTVDKIDRADLAGKLHPIEWAFNVALVYGRRRFQLPGSVDHVGDAEVLLIDVFNVNQQRLNNFKYRLAETFGIDSTRYEADWGYEEYARLAEPAFYALLALLDDAELPCGLVSHEFMGMPTAFKAILDGQKQFRTAFHAHECGTARRIVENHPGHDVAFYNVLRKARAEHHFVEDVFGDQSDSFRHALVSRAHLCDAILAVGDYTAQEMHFLGDHFDHHVIDLVYNGIPHLKVDAGMLERSRAMMCEYAQRLIGWKPDVIMTHVTRPVISKGIWRDFLVCDELDRMLARESRRGALFILTSAGGARRPQDIRSMEDEYGWPRQHRAGYPDLVGPELDLAAIVDRFNASHTHVQAVLVNQFGWSGELIGDRLPAKMDFGDLRRATDVEFGMATYEPFGISPLEPLGAGAICVISSVCGCAAFVRDAGAGLPLDNVIIADFIQLPRDMSIDELRSMSQSQRDEVERRVTSDVAAELMRRLPRTAGDRKRLLEQGQALAARLTWDRVLERHLRPVVRRVMGDRYPGSESAMPRAVDAVRPAAAVRR